MMKINGVLYLIILSAFDTCDCKCDEYIIVLKEKATDYGINFQPLKMTDVFNELTSFNNATSIYNELHSFKDCILEMECKGYNTYCPKKIVVTNLGKHSEELTNSTIKGDFKTSNETNVSKTMKPEIVENEDKSVYDLNIIYVNKKDIQNNTDLIYNHTKNTMFMVVCDYAENSCDDDDLNETNLNKYISNDNALNETMKDLRITLKRDEGSTIQPIFTGFASKNSTTGTTKNTPLEVTLICKYKEVRANCKRKVNNSTEEHVNAASNSINVYLKSDYIQNGTKIKYAGCTKDSGDTNNTFNIQCDGTNFTYINQDVLLTYSISSEHNETLNLHCQITESYMSTEAKGPKGVSQDYYDLLHFNDCYSNQNISNRTDSGQQNITLFLKSKKYITENITINDDVEFNKTKVPIEDKVNMNEKNMFKMHITADKKNNCSQNRLFSITGGQVIDKGKYFIKEDIPKHDDVELKLLNCLNEKYSFNNNTQTYGPQLKLVIIFKNETDINKIDEKLDELNESISIILICNPSYLDEHEHKIDCRNKTVFECESMDVNNYTTTGINSSNILSDEEIIDTNKVNRSDIDGERKYNCSFNATEETYCVPTCDNEKVDGCYNISSNDEDNKNNKSTDEKDLSNKKYNLTVGFEKANDSQSNGSKNLTIKNGDSLERIGLITLVSIAGTGLFLAFVLKKCAKRPQYAPAPRMEPQDLEDTAF